MLGKVLGGTALALLQVSVFWLLAPLAGVWTGPLEIGALVLFFALSGMALTALGFAIAWPMDSTQGFHAIMSVVLMPMWLLSGAFFPAEGAGPLGWIMRLNPMTYMVADRDGFCTTHGRFPRRGICPPYGCACWW